MSIACQKFPRETVPPRGQEIHPMDCTDMVIGMARDGRGFVADYYTRDRSTPRRDAFWVRGDLLHNYTCHRKRERVRGKSSHLFYWT